MLGPCVMCMLGRSQINSNLVPVMREEKCVDKTNIYTLRRGKNEGGRKKLPPAS